MCTHSVLVALPDPVLACTLKHSLTLPFVDCRQEMFFVAEGLAEVFLDLSKPALATVGKGKFFGEGALLEREPRNAYIRAKTQM